ncbi:LysR family transcriptional regulator [Secundilactobacillus collinoides]|uniref:LysR family transcriptional regulator n=1 Tax=Secundilactobacillus collinoides TaxID=33960 RepID=UPI0006CF2604|nr:LysR family transcriptional regulator [Secundilactobacillus collinoides]
MNPYLNTFIYVYETRSFSLAAQELFVTQPAVSIKIQQLERQVGQPLFVRTNHRTITPTSAGNLLYEKSLEIRKIWNETQDKLNHIANPQRHLLRIGFSQTTSQIFASRFIDQIQTVLPLIDWQVIVGNSNYIAEQLSHKCLDIGLIEKPISINPIVIKRKKIGIDQLVRIGEKTGTWLQRESGSGVGHYTTQFFQEYAVIPKKVIQVNRNGLIMKLVNQGVGETIMSQRVIPRELAYSPLSAHFQRNLYSLITSDLEVNIANTVNHLLFKINASWHNA